MRIGKPEPALVCTVQLPDATPGASGDARALRHAS
jgi:hypothetical protein